MTQTTIRLILGLIFWIGLLSDWIQGFPLLSIISKPAIHPFLSLIIVLVIIIAVTSKYRPIHKIFMDLVFIMTTPIILPLYVMLRPRFVLRSIPVLLTIIVGSSKPLRAASRYGIWIAIASYGYYNIAHGQPSYGMFWGLISSISLSLMISNILRILKDPIKLVPGSLQLIAFAFAENRMQDFANDVIGEKPNAVSTHLHNALVTLGIFSTRIADGANRLINGAWIYIRIVMLLVILFGSVFGVVAFLHYGLFTAYPLQYEAEPGTRFWNFWVFAFTATSISTNTGGIEAIGGLSQTIEVLSRIVFLAVLPLGAVITLIRVAKSNFTNHINGITTDFRKDYSRFKSWYKIKFGYEVDDFRSDFEDINIHDISSARHLVIGLLRFSIRAGMIDELPIALNREQRRIIQNANRKKTNKRRKH